MKLSKKYIRTNGGSSRANNISEAVRDLDSIPQGSGGGTMVVEFKMITESGPYECNHTIDEVREALKTGNVVGVFTNGEAGSIPMGNAIVYQMEKICFNFQGISDDEPMYSFTSDSDSEDVIFKFGEWGFTGF